MPEEKAVQIRMGDLRVVNEIAPRTPTHPLYHYTRRSGLLGIVCKQELWASNARYLNDSQELTAALTLARELVRKPNNDASPEETNLAESIKKFLDLMETAWDVFVFSLSEQSDDLSQWRAYCDPGNGYSVGFDPARLESAADTLGFNLIACQYQPQEHERLMRMVIEESSDRLRNDLRDGLSKGEALMNAFATFSAGFFVVAPLIKHQTFEGEKEWRLILPVSSVWQPGVKFRDAGRLLIPYIPIKFPRDPYPIVRVVVGPTPHPKLETRALSGLFTGKGLPQVQVAESQVPYRPW